MARLKRRSTQPSRQAGRQAGWCVRYSPVSTSNLTVDWLMDRWMDGWVNEYVQGDPLPPTRSLSTFDPAERWQSLASDVRFKSRLKIVVVSWAAEKRERQLFISGGGGRCRWTWTWWRMCVVDGRWGRLLQMLRCLCRCLRYLTLDQTSETIKDPGWKYLSR